MKFLKKKNWPLFLILNIITQGIFTFVIAYYLGIYEEDKWYKNWRYWFSGAICMIVPAMIMFIVFILQSTCEVAAKLNVPGKEIYNTPYSWILCIIVPFVGWSLLIVMYLYINIWTVVMLAKGEGEKYINLVK